MDYKHKELINISGILFARSCLLTPLNSLLAAADRNATLPIAEHRTRPLLPFFPPGDPWAGPSGATGRAPSAPTHISAAGRLLTLMLIIRLGPRPRCPLPGPVCRMAHVNAD